MLITRTPCGADPPNACSLALAVPPSEHRYYGESMPLSNRSLTNEGLVYLVRCWAMKYCCRVGTSPTNKGLLVGCTW